MLLVRDEWDRAEAKAVRKERSCKARKRWVGVSSGWVSELLEGVFTRLFIRRVCRAFACDFVPVKVAICCRAFDRALLAGGGVWGDMESLVRDGVRNGCGLRLGIVDAVIKKGNTPWSVVIRDIGLKISSGFVLPVVLENWNTELGKGLIST